MHDDVDTENEQTMNVYFSLHKLMMGKLKQAVGTMSCGHINRLDHLLCEQAISMLIA